MPHVENEGECGVKEGFMVLAQATHPWQVFIVNL